MSILIDKKQNFRDELIKWYNKNHRILPWRETKDPYKIWLSEIILQQTRVNQGMKYYQKFLLNYPKICSLAKASEEEVLKMWQGLGYYSRARNLHFTAKHICFQLKGKFPDDFDSIRQLKGVGDYTAAAIASFAFDLPHAVIDGNVYRVLSRLFGIQLAIDTAEGKSKFRQVAEKLLNQKQPAIHNQAMMEFGAVQCLPKNPKCDHCVFQENCVAYQENLVNDLPIKQKKIKQKNRYFHYLLITVASKIFIHKREGNEIWQNLYDFPLIETNKNISVEQLIRNESLRGILDHGSYSFDFASTPRKHILTHQKIYATFYHFQLDDQANIKSKKYRLIEKEKLKNYPIPKLIENYLMEETNLLYLS